MRNVGEWGKGDGFELVRQDVCKSDDVRLTSHDVIETHMKRMDRIISLIRDKGYTLIVQTLTDI